MGYAGQPYRFPFDLAGFQYNRNTDLLGETALVDGTKNVNFHEGGIGKRGGTSLYLASALSGNPAIRGLYDFRKQNGNSYRMFADAGGKVYHTAEANLLKSNMSLSNKFNFSVFDDEVYIADGATTPQVWDGSAAFTSNIAGIPTDWTSTSIYPFQIVPHARGANARQWAITSDAVYASKNGDGDNFADAEVKKIPVYSESGLVGGYDFNGTLFVFSKTEPFIIDDTSADTAEWGYKKAIWEGGVAHWRLITKAGNNLYLMMDDGLIYSIRAVQSSGDYEQVAINKPAFIDRWIREKTSLNNIENFHSIYNRKLRCIDYFVQVSGSNTNTVLRYFIDRPPEIAWVIEDNTDNPSGYNASVSAEFKSSTGNYFVSTGDFSGKIWDLEQTTKSDNSLAYTASVKTRKINMGGSRVWKHFKSLGIRVSSAANADLTVRIWIDGVRKSDKEIEVAGSGAAFDEAEFDTSVFSEDSIVPYVKDLGYYGFDIQIEIVNDTSAQDFFLSEMLIDYKNIGIRNTASV